MTKNKAEVKKEGGPPTVSGIVQQSQPHYGGGGGGRGGRSQNKFRRPSNKPTGRAIGGKQYEIK